MNVYIAQPLGIEQEVPTFDTDRDGFPYPGQVIRYFRQLKIKADGKPWTQHDLAQYLGKQDLAVRDMELRDAGLNDITRLRLLANVFDIPLILFGLVALPEQRNTNGAATAWWIERDFPAFDTGPDGFPYPGQVIRHFRQLKIKADGKPWTQSDLAQVLKKKELAVRDMELRDTGLNHLARRRFLVHLFDIPPLLLGLATHLPQQRSVTRQSSPVSTPIVLSISKALDLEEVRDALTRFWTKQACTPHEMLAMIDATVKHFYERYPTTSSETRTGVVTDLCELHIHASNILRDRGRFRLSLEHLKKAEDLNTLLNEVELQADLLYRRGGVYLDKGDLSLALDEYHAAEQVLEKVSPPLQMAVLLETSLAEARIAPSKKQRKVALKKMDQVGHLIRGGQTQAGREKWPYINVDLVRYHLDRSTVLILAGSPKEAQDELALIAPAQLRGRRSVYHLILQARACFHLKEYVQAAQLAEQAWPLARVMRSHVNQERIKTLYKHLQQTPFRNNPEVASLEYVLFYASK
jgi:tetratricopeptide (TPR) repeat protein